MKRSVVNIRPVSLMLTIVVTGLFLVAGPVNAQEKKINNDPVFEKVAEMPQFQNGDLNSFRNWVQLQVKYPQEAVKSKIQGNVMAEFIVEKDGSVKEVKIKKGVPELNDEVLRVVKLSPAWVSGKNSDGEAVRVKFVITIKFALS